MAFANSMAILLAARSTADVRLEFYAVIGALIGVYLFYRGFRMLQYKRLIQNTPFSKVRSASMGLVEISGMTAGPQTIPAAITQQACYYYRAIVWKLEQSGRNSQWKRVLDESLFVPFFIEDDTGRMLINPQGAEMDMRPNFKDEIRSSFFGKDMVPENVAQFLLTRGLAGRDLRVEEYCIKPGHPLFVLGTLCENRQLQWVPLPHTQAKRFSLGFQSAIPPAGGNTFIRGLGRLSGNAINAAATMTTSRSAPAAPASAAPKPTAAVAASSWASVSMDDELQTPAHVAIAEPSPPAAPDTADSCLSPADSSAAVATDPQPEDAAQTPTFDMHPPAAIAKGAAGDPFTICSESRREFVASLGWKSAACIWGGPVLTLVCLYFLFAYLHVQ